MAAPNGVSDLIIKTLREFGPMTRIDLEEQTGLRRSKLAAVINRLKTKQVHLPKRVYISTWTWESSGQRRYPRPVYAEGNHWDAPRPERTPREEVVRKYQESLVNRVRSSSVFNMGMSAKSIIRGKRSQEPQP
jgi:hypothetical protein